MPKGKASYSNCSDFQGLSLLVLGEGFCQKKSPKWFISNWLNQAPFQNTHHLFPIGSMGRLDPWDDYILKYWLVDFYGKFTSPMDPMGIFSTSCSVHNFRTEIREMNNVEQQKNAGLWVCCRFGHSPRKQTFHAWYSKQLFFVGCFSWMMNQIGLFRIPGVY